jgi:hypothetical protein
MKKIITPQEKKKLSYAKDCRNTYGENDKSSRKNIPLRKAKANRSDRKKLNDILQKVENHTDISDIEIIESIENEVLSVKRNYWKKCSDEPLGKAVERKLERQENHAGNGKTARKKAREFIANLKIELKQAGNGSWIAKTDEPKRIEVYGDTQEIATEKCKRLAGYFFLEQLGTIGIITLNENFVSVITN